MSMLTRSYMDTGAVANTRLTIGLELTSTTLFNGAGTNYVVKTASAIYIIYQAATGHIVYIKSTNGGTTYGAPVIIKSTTGGTPTQFSVWYDGWSGLSTGLIHVAYVDTADDTMYRTVDTASGDALSTQTVLFVGATTAAGGHLSITRTRGGNVLCKTCIDNGAEGGFFKLLNANVPNGAWKAALTINEALAASDQMIILPGFAADNNDAIGIFWDADANEISRQLYDDSANTWSETSIATSMTDLVATTAFPNFATAVDLTNSRIVLVAWTQADLLNADLRCWTITEGAITEVTNVVLNSTDDQGLCAIAIDTANDDWYVMYAGKSDGSETWNTALRIYYKVSTDNGSTWSAEALLAPDTTATQMIVTLIGCPNFTGNMPFVYAWRDENFTLVYILTTIIERNP